MFTPLATASNSILVLTHTFLGITPHALYLHDHFEGYDQILAITYLDGNVHEQWLPFVNQEGRLLAPNWGRVQSMWANVAVHGQYRNSPISKFIKKLRHSGALSWLESEPSNFQYQTQRNIYTFHLGIRFAQA